jgi:transcriptional regulator with XRE-family HTH domain
MSENKFVERLNALFDADPRNDSGIADALGVSKQTISYWRKGERSPKKSVITRIADAFNVSPAWLLGWDDLPTAASATSGQTAQTEKGIARLDDADRLEALHQNPRLGLLFDRARRMSSADVEFMLQLQDRIMKERDND